MPRSPRMALLPHAGAQPSPPQGLDVPESLTPSSHQIHPPPTLPYCSGPEQSLPESRALGRSLPQGVLQASRAGSILTVCRECPVLWEQACLNQQSPGVRAATGATVRQCLGQTLTTGLHLETLALARFSSEVTRQRTESTAFTLG